MKKAELCERLAEGSLSRRQLNRILAAAGLAVVTLPLTSRMSRAEEQVTYFTWSGYDVPEFFPGYVKKYGTNPNMPLFSDEEDGFQKLRAGFYADVAHPCSGRIKRWRDAGVIRRRRAGHAAGDDRRGAQLLCGTAEMKPLLVQLASDSN